LSSKCRKRKASNGRHHRWNPELRAQVMKMIEAYESGRYMFVFKLPVDQQVSKETGLAFMKAMAGFVRAYENNEFSPSMQKKIITTLRKTVKQFAPR
jgi:hypothetical protein